jgi:hypothetical protein
MKILFWAGKIWVLAEQSGSFENLYVPVQVGNEICISKIAYFLIVLLRLY